MKGVVVRIVARHDSTDDFAIPPCEEERGVPVLEKRMLLAIEKFFALENQGRHPGRIVAINLPRKFDEGVTFRVGNDFRNLYGRHASAEAALVSEPSFIRGEDLVRKT